MNNLPKVVTQRCLEQHLNPRPTDRKPKCLTRCTTAPHGVSFLAGSQLYTQSQAFILKDIVLYTLLLSFKFPVVMSNLYALTYALLFLFLHQCVCYGRLRSRCGHYIFAMWLLSSSIFFISSPNLRRRRLDVCHTSTHGVAFVRI